MREAERRRRTELRDAAPSSVSCWALTDPLFCLQNLFERVLLFLIHGKQLTAQVAVGGIHARLGFQVGDGAIEYEKLFAIVGDERSRGIFELRTRLRVKLVDGAFVRGFGALDFVHRAIVEQSVILRNAGGTLVRHKPQCGARQNHEKQGRRGGLPLQ